MERDPFLEITHEWYVWHIGDDDFKRVGELRGKKSWSREWYGYESLLYTRPNKDWYIQALSN